MSVISGRRGTPSRPCRQECFLRSVPLSFHTTRVTRPGMSAKSYSRTPATDSCTTAVPCPVIARTSSGSRTLVSQLRIPVPFLNTTSPELLQPTSGLRGHQLRLDGRWLRLAAARMPSSAALSSSIGARSPSPGTHTPRRPRSARRARHRSPGPPAFRPRRGPTVHTPADGTSFRRRWRRSVPAAWAVTTSPLAAQALGMSRPASRLRRPGVNEHPGAQYQQAPWVAAGAGVTRTLVGRATARPGRSTRRCRAVRRAVGRQAHPFRGSVVQ